MVTEEEPLVVTNAAAEVYIPSAVEGYNPAKKYKQSLLGYSHCFNFKMQASGQCKNILSVFLR